MNGRASVIGAGPNGLSAAIVLAQAGFQVEVFEAEPQPGGAARTLELTIPGFFHDFGSAVHPLAVGSPFFSSLPLASYGLEWIHSPSTLAHPFDDGTAITLERDFSANDAALGKDAKVWRRLMEPLAENWPALSAEVLRPVHIFSRHPWLLARFGLSALPSANALSRLLFREERTKALFAGLAAHSFLSLDEPLSAGFGVLLGAAAHAVGWPIPRGGAQSITNALCSHLANLGAKIKTSSRVDKLGDSCPIRCDDVRCDTKAVAANGGRPSVGKLSTPTREVPQRPGRLQSGLRPYKSDPLEGPRVLPGGHRPPGGQRIGNNSFRGCNPQRAARGAAIRVVGTAKLIRRHAGAPRKAHSVGLLPRPLRIEGRRAPKPGTSNRAFRARLPRHRVGAARFVSRGTRSHGCQPYRRRHRGWRFGCPAVLVSTDVAALRDFGTRSIYMFVIDAARSRGAWNVRVPCGAIRGFAVRKVGRTGCDNGRYATVQWPGGALRSSG